MKSSLVILLIGTIVAVACAAPSRSLKVSLQDDDGDKLAKTARWFGIAKRVIGGINHAINGEKEAVNQMDDDDGDDLLSQALLDRIQKQVALKQEVSTEEDEDDDDGDKAVAQFIHHVLRFLG